MAFEATPAVLNEISRLLVQAETATDQAERAAAVRKLWALYTKLEADLVGVERDIRTGINRRVEAVVYRATLATLGTELSLMGEERPQPPA